MSLVGEVDAGAGRIQLSAMAVEVGEVAGPLFLRHRDEGAEPGQPFLGTLIEVSAS
ncbi:MAG: hypothetical protein ACR2LI_03445 [Propionibacteriaceae bacterium]